MMIDLNGDGKKFYSLVGVDEESGENASIEFFILGDKKNTMAKWYQEKYRQSKRSGYKYFGNTENLPFMYLMEVIT